MAENEDAEILFLIQHGGATEKKANKMLKHILMSDFEINIYLRRQRKGILHDKEEKDSS